MSNVLLRWELAGVVAIGLAGSFLHFAFDLSGAWKPLGAVSAVNESVWEHLKLAFWPGLAYAAVEYPFIRRLAHNYATAKACGLYIMPAAIVALFYLYTWIAGDSILALDILIFWIAVTLGQLVSYRVMRAKRVSPWVDVTGLILIVALAVVFAVFTYYPPRLFLFRDPNSMGYGILD